MNGRRALLLGAGIAGALLGCAHFPENESLPQPDGQAGYRFANYPANRNDEELFVVLTLSGGGTRASALAYSVMDELDGIVLPGESGRTLLDEVDLISSVSGGSFTAGYYALHGKRLFDDFEERFLRHNVQGALFWRLINPINWWRFASPWFDRVDMAAEYYDREIFDRATYGHLLANRGERPFVILNATDMSLGSRFEFTQDQFDLINSDLSKFKLGRAAAASSAFPGLLSPVRLVNHANEGPIKQPMWINTGLESRDNTVRYRRCRDAQSYMDTAEGTTTKLRSYVHLMDGGVSDNIGLRGTLDALVENAGPMSLLDIINIGVVQRIVIIVVDAKTKAPTDWDQSASAPGLVDTLMTAVNTPMDSYSTDTVTFVSDVVERLQQVFQTDEKNRKELVAIAEKHNEPLPDYFPGPNVAFNFVYLGFDNLDDPKHPEYHDLQDQLNNLPTSFSLDDEQVDLLLEAGPLLMKRSKAFRTLKCDLGVPPKPKAAK